jgi:hypothetical protein
MSVDVVVVVVVVVALVVVGRETRARTSRVASGRLERTHERFQIISWFGATASSSSYSGHDSILFPVIRRTRVVSRGEGPANRTGRVSVHLVGV